MSARRYSAVLLTVAALVLIGMAPAAAETLPPDLKIEKVMDNSADLGNLVQSPTGELWLLERGGAVRVTVGGQVVANTSISVTNTCQAGLQDLAFAQDYAASGLAFIYYVDGSNHAVVDQMLRTPTSVALGARILDFGVVSDACRPGGGVQIGKDGKLYISVGDLGLPANAQSDSSLVGKVLRVNPDGSIPADNPTPGSMIWAKGLRNGKGLAYNPDSARAGGTFYLSDIGSASSPTAYDEVNAVRAAGNYAWNLGSGPYGGYDLPLVSFASGALINPDGLAALHHSRLGADRLNALVYAAPTNDAGAKGTIRLLPLSGAALDVAGTEKTLYKPDGDLDGTPDTICPERVNALMMGGDGAIYTANLGANKGIYRIFRDHAGPREVSYPGSPFQLLVEKGSGSSLTLRWENIGGIDAGRAKRYAAGQRAEAYRIFEGTLPITSASDYDHTAILSTNGDAGGEAAGRLHATITAGAGSRYYLIGAQGDNLEGSLGTATGGAERPFPGTHDYCDTIGWGNGGAANNGKCFRDFRRNDGTPLKLVDYNPVSPTYLKAVSLADFRGKAIRIDISALDCIWCKRQAYCFKSVDEKIGDQDAMIITIMMRSYGDWSAITSAAECETQIKNWQLTYGDRGPILCDVDQDGSTGADAAHQITPGTCGTPENFYIDQGMVQYDYVCGAEEYNYPPFFACGSVILNHLSSEANAEGCN